MEEKKVKDPEKKPADEATGIRDPMRLYLKEIEAIPLLTPEEEVEFAGKVRKGDKAARRKMIRSNLRLVISIAKRYAHLGLPLSDLVEEGNLGLMKAVARYNPNKGYRFSTYASWWIKQSIMRALSDQGKTIRVPVYMSETIARLKKVTESLTQRFGRRPTIKELAKVMKLSLKRMREIMEMAARPTSLNAPISVEGTGQLMDLIEDESVSAPSKGVDELMRRERVVELLGMLDDREREVLTLRFGLKDGKSHTLAETAKKFDLTRERMRQIEASAIRKLKLFIQLDEGELSGL